MDIPFDTIRGFLLLALGFGFVVFWHELGHFLAAKWAGVKVEQFAVGFGQALVAFRKGLGVRIGSTNKEFKRRIKEHLTAKGRVFKEDDDDDLTEREVATASQELGISETEYRWNWIPLGGYVKMLGQDDLRPNAEAADPRAFNRQSIGKRMVIVSAGVVMNIILAAVGFMILFLYGFNVPPAKVGAVAPGSPAQVAGMQPGDRILTIDGKPQSDDWTKVQLSIALADPDEPTPITVERVVDGQTKVVTLQVLPRRSVGLARDILQLGIAPPHEMSVPGGKAVVEAYARRKEALAKMVPAESRLLEPGDTVIAVNGQAIDPKDPNAYVQFDRLVQASQGKPVKVTIRHADGRTDEKEVQPRFLSPYGETPLSFAGLLTRMRVDFVYEDSPAFNKVMPGDVVAAVATGPEKNTLYHPEFRAFRKRVNEAGQAGQTVDLTLVRDGQTVQVAGLTTKKIDPDGTQGLRIGPGHEQQTAVVADTVKDSAAAKANIPGGSKIVEVAGQAVVSWADVHRAMVGWLGQRPAAGGDAAGLPVTYETADGGKQTAQLALSGDEAAALQGYRYMLPLAGDFEPRLEPRKTSSPWTAAKWGVTETRDFILQFYVTLKRMVTGGVSVKNLMGPVGIFQAGTGFATKGTDWLIWFLAMISANLAVVNFLPIPIVDGGLFTFLILEKIKGRPLSPRIQAIAQYVGLALLLGVFLFVTYQDVTNFFFRMR